MPTVFSANRSGIQVNGHPVEGVQGIDFQHVRERSDVYGLGADERLAVYYGATRVSGRIRVASAHTELDDLIASGAAFQVVANLRTGQAARTVAFDDCYMEKREFSMVTGGHAETIYSFSATRVRQEDGGGAAG